MNIIRTRYGDIPVFGRAETHSNGGVKSCVPAGEVPLVTPLGEFTPQSTADDVRRRAVEPLRFHPNGKIRSMSLERTARVRTLSGEIPAEFLTFHESGALHRVFPLNGKLSGYWTQEDEAGLAKPVLLDTPVGQVKLRIIGARFFPDGRLCSLTLWPDETINVPTPAGEIPARIGVSFRENGGVRSLEPARPLSVATPVGDVQAFDPDAVGVSGDRNSLEFGRDGGVRSVATTLTRVVVEPESGKPEILSPGVRESLCGTTDMEPVPLRLRFEKDCLAVLGSNGGNQIFAYDTNRFHTEPHLPGLSMPFKELRCSV